MTASARAARLGAVLLLAAGPVAAQEAGREAEPAPVVSETGAVERAARPRPRPSEAPRSAALTAPGAPVAPDAPRAPPPSAGVQVRALDKFSGLTTQFGAQLGDPTRYERLTITVRICERRPGGDVAFIVIADDKTPDAPVFSGWMFADSPALSALDHPRYDVWLASCSTRAAEAP
ncbi:DUF2155 domain-containing protein [Rubrimonas sp.]|uniref:DUF2155 domain-containing protein n=1 Tax=Rubrimonas sp. TaxID=2036015 RepID=UPI002FDCF858